MRAAGVLFVLGAAGVGSYFVRLQDATAGQAQASRQNTASASQSGPSTGAEPAGRPMASTLTLRFDGQSVPTPLSKLGASRQGDEIHVDRGAVETTLRGLKETLDRAPSNARFDLEAQVIHPAKEGLGIDLFGSVSAIEVAIRSGSREVELEGVALPAAVTIETLGIRDISAVLGEFTTKFSVGEKTRNANLKLLASKIDGYVLEPGEEFSFNDLTGDRLLEDGFKMAHVISQGQFIDGMAGGSCQISTTLHGAAFFSGLDILSVTPHSRPSTYVTLGLDATVVASRVDLKLRNPYEFPVVIHYRVARGEAHVKILGREKPFDEIEFERNIDERIDFQTITREDSDMGMGYMVIDQPGYPGYKLSKIRRTYKDGKVIKTDKWKLRYQPVVEYARLGINPDPNLPAPKKKRGHGPKPTSGRFALRQ